VEVDVGCSVDVELVRSLVPVSVLLLLHLIAYQLRLSIVDHAQAPVALANPFSQEGDEQAVALGRTRVEGADVCSRTNLI
jgi:hypothetical protein